MCSVQGEKSNRKPGSYEGGWGRIHGLTIHDYVGGIEIYGALLQERVQGCFTWDECITCHHRRALRSHLRALSLVFNKSKLI